MDYSTKPANYPVRPHFLKHELECRHCGLCVITEASLDKLERLRILLGKPITLNCACRCKTHNDDPRVGGQPNSKHIGSANKESCAFDIHCYKGFQVELIAAAKNVGFMGIGIYDNFIHVDDRKVPAQWNG